MNLLPDSEQQQIVDALSGFLVNEAPVERLRPDRGGQVGNADHLIWPKLGELGFWGLGAPEASGGAGLSLAEEYIVFREYGRHLLSLGALGITIAVHIAAQAGLPDLAADLMSGARRVALASPRDAQLVLGSSSSGRVHLLEARDADYVVAWSDAGAALFEASQFAIGESPMAVDSHMTLARAVLDNGKPIGWIPTEQSNIAQLAMVLIAGYAVGLSEGSRDMAVDYAKMREQFGKIIGSFQAVKHRCADMAILTEVAYCQTSYAALVVRDMAPDAAAQAASAVLLAIDAALRTAASNIQVHGAFGFTAEGDAHLYLKRAHVLETLVGGLRRQKQKILRHVLAA
jgi:alkylation response protein AidB-like acyl-CoA dehydrogenase